MDEDNNSNINKFETILRSYCESKSLLYSEQIKAEETSQILKPKDVLNKINEQIKALNNSNETSGKTINNRIKAYKGSKLTSLNILSDEPQKQLVEGGFDNQCKYDTHLLLGTKEVEAVSDLGPGVTQEFETSFDQKPMSQSQEDYLNIVSKSSKILKMDEQSQYHVIQESTKPNNYEFSQKNYQIDNSVNVRHNMQNISDTDNNSPSSPILLSKKTKCDHNTSFLLESFEKFESIAVPIVHENTDVEAVKKMINFKMLHDKESQTISEPSYEKKIIRLSPISKLNTDQEEIKRHMNCDLHNNNEFVKEEILFSSDEETENTHNPVGELPLTCALQTSFYEQEHLLDKTIYVGFQTASNKSIQVLTDSFTKAKSVLNDFFDTKNPINSLSLSELVDVYDSASKERKNCQTSIKSKSYTETCKTVQNAFDNINIDNCDKENYVSGVSPAGENVLFKTNKVVVCTQEQIKIDDYMMEEFEDNLCIDDNKLHTNIISNQPVIFNDEVQIKSNDTEQNKMCKKKPQIGNLDIWDDATLCLNDDQTYITNINDKKINQLFTGFKTASNKAVNISEAALAKSRKIYDEILFQSSASSDELGSKTNDNRNVTNKHFQGFNTASNKPISISDKAYAQSKKILQDNILFMSHLTDMNLNKKETTDKTQNESHFTKVENNKGRIPFGFKTASNMPIKVSKEALLKTINILQDFDCGNDLLISGKNETDQILHDLDLKEEFVQNFEAVPNLINILEESKKKSEEVSIAKDKTDYYSNCSATNGLSSIKENIIQRTYNDKNLNLIEFSKKNLSITGNSTSNNNAKITNKKLNLNVNLEIENNAPNEDSSYSNAVFITANNNRTKSPEDALIKSKNGIKKKYCKNAYKEIDDDKNSDALSSKVHIEKYSNFHTHSFQGFKTASDKPVKISDKALEATKKIFMNIDDDNICNLVTLKAHNEELNKLHAVKNMFQGFKTASINPLTTSESALVTSKKIFEIIDNDIICDSVTFKAQNEDLNQLHTNAFQGFKTAHNNPVKISDKALEASKKIFKNIDDDNICDSVMFKAHNEKLNKLPTITNTTIRGFKTANNNQVNVSNKALEKSKQIFQDLGDYNHCDLVASKTQNEELSRLDTLKDAFQGFKTASKKPVEISNEALKRSKIIFEEINGITDISDKLVIENTAFNKFDFQSENNKEVKIIENTCKKKEIIFKDIDSNLKTKLKQKLKCNTTSMHSAPCKVKSNLLEFDSNMQLDARITILNNDKTLIKNCDESNFINTEVVNNFNDTMFTEDFLNKSPCNKRSGSPILSCPKPKKAKTKLSNDQNFYEGEPAEKRSHFCFSTNYKKLKKYRLLDVYEMEKVLNRKQSCLQEVNYDIDNVAGFTFVGARNELSNSKWTAVNLKNLLFELVNKNIIPNGWIENHIKLITLKLLSYEKRFPNSMQNVCSVCNVMEQLKYRYERELYNVERPALRKILEKDEVPSRRMVLQVLNIYKDGVSVVANTLNTAENVELLLSDGWYCVKATIDKLLTKYVCEGKITTGTKLVTHGAELLNCEQGVAPWEDTSMVRLKIFGNSTRRAHWTAKLGFHGNGAILSYLTSVKPEGGKISQLRIIVTRVYPMLYVEKFDDGSTVTRSERLENLYQMKYEMERETLLEKIYEEVEKEFSMQASQCDSVDDDRKSLESGSQIYQSLKRSRDPAEFRAGLTHSQATILQHYVDKRREMSLQNLQSRVHSVIKKRGLNVTRNVVAMLKIRVADVYQQNVTKAMITIWRPHESLLHLLREGTWLDIHNVVPTAVRYSEIQISAGKQSLFRNSSKVNSKMLNVARTFERKCYLIQELTHNPYLTSDYNEVDTVGFVFDVQPPVDEFDCKKQLFQNVFLADVNKKMICINFWGGLKKFGYEKILELEQVVACVNLQKRSGNTRKNIPQYRATEFTYFTKTPKIDACRKICEDLSKQFLYLDRRKFIQDCVILRNNLINMKYGNIENISPYRFNNSDYNLSKNKTFINSPIADPNLNLKGLDFDSTFKQSEPVLSPKALLRKKEVSERIAKLQKYGEPPPLSAIHIVNKSREAVKPFRSPLISKRETNNNQSKIDKLASVNIQNATNAVDDCGVEKSSNECTSPVLPYKRRSVNPVRLNFSKQNEMVKEDPFGEDFETSPPLSLD